MRRALFCAVLSVVLLGKWGSVKAQCDIRLIESIPENLTYAAGSVNHTSTYDAWKTLISLSTEAIHIGSFYWSLTGKEIMNVSIPASKEGEDILNLLQKKSMAINLRIATNGPRQKNYDLDLLARGSKAEIRWVDFQRLGLTGILHTKLWIVDSQHAYLGSANMDWRSLTEVKELGLLFLNCPEVVSDLQTMFYVYWYLGHDNATIPAQWPDVLSAKSNISRPIDYDGASQIFFANSPEQFSTRYRTQDIDALVHAIRTATKFVYISVMDYAPLIVSYKKGQKSRFWPDIDDAIREAAVIRNIRVRLLISHWNHSAWDMVGYLASLRALSKIPRVYVEVKLFVVPSFTPEQAKIPYGRVNHNKYMVTDQCAYIGTSNWSGDYFNGTAGISATIALKKGASAQVDLRLQTEQIFLRDWYSKYAHPLAD